MCVVFTSLYLNVGLCVHYYCYFVSPAIKQKVSSILCFCFTGAIQGLIHDYAKMFSAIAISPQENTDS